MRRLSLVLILLAPAARAAPVDFVREVRPILESRCYDCHGPAKHKSGLRLDIKAAALKGGDNHGPDILPGNAQDSPLIHFLTTTDEDHLMPPDGRLSPAEISLLTRWINEGAPWPDGIDTARLEDKTDHWSFKPLNLPPGSPGIDHFIDAKLAEKNLSRSPPASPADWLRRVTLDLIGLPPTPEETAAFTRHPDHAAAIDRLLASPRYGERWAQHWLDVVRYADTHGFEVNTERPNAWPYRDYVIQAFNADLPYDQFIRHQIAGDQLPPPPSTPHLNPDAATGFLVTASVLLPGQIGKDAPSMRLARQDSLDEIVINIGQTFLGLSLGCARCHDHKFDPVSARDYYAMQAFVAGVEYADRPLKTPAATTAASDLLAAKKRLAEIETRLAQFTPLASPGRPPRSTSPWLNQERFPPHPARFIRFTIHDSNLHPKLGLIEPCIDEFEIFAENSAENLAPAAKVTASGSRTSPSHKLEHLTDTRYGNARSWMSSTKGTGWIEFELPAPVPVSRIVWSRDRLGQYTDRLPTAFTLQAGLSRDHLATLAEARPPRPTVNWKLTTDRFSPVKASRLRFTILATNGLAPCIDELEVFDTRGRNLAPRATVTTSGSLLVPDRHQPSFVNDGRYGNERSWLGNQDGRGWVELAFPAEAEITRVLWSRDRLGALQDRMPTDYRIEVSSPGRPWTLVADSSDRRPFIAGTPIDAPFTTSGLPPAEARQADSFLQEKNALEARIASAQQGQLAFAGQFRAPDTIHLLHRGDPEQPRDVVPPAIPAALGQLALPPSTPEAARRRALADWIASPRNPLTARVMVNRVWQAHFGTGLVETASDFGRSGLPPSHPGLLDWLAAEFIRSGWSVKHLHRLITLSHTYRQSSRIPPPSTIPHPALIDADARLLWRFPSRRLDSEVIHDSILAVSGRLNLAMHGRGYDLFDKRGGLSGFRPVESFTPANQRRRIYAHKVRRERDAVFGAFDCPDAGQSTATRRQSTTPIQALNLFNSPFILHHAQTLASRVEKESAPHPSAQITRAFLFTLNRPPTQAELADTEPLVRQHGLPVLCRALLNTNEFLFQP